MNWINAKEKEPQFNDRILISVMENGNEYQQFVIVRSWPDGVIKLVKVGTLELSEYEYKDVSFWFKVEKAFK